MEQILYIREIIISYFKRYETVVLSILKLIAGVFIFSVINGIGHVHPELASKLPPSFLCSLLLGILFSVLPLSVSYLFMIVCIAIQLSANVEAAFFVTLTLLCILCFYARLAPKESALILATIFAFYFRIPYIVPLLAGLYCRLSGILPVTAGVFIWHFSADIDAIIAASPTAGFNIMDMPGSMMQLLPVLVGRITGNQQWILTAFIFAMAIIIVHVIAGLSMDFAKEAAILLGAVLIVVSFIIAAIVVSLSTNILAVVFFTILSAALAEAVRFFDSVLDYQRAEYVQFEDEDNYYYVKVIPKVILTRRNRTVRRIRPQREEMEEDSYRRRLRNGTMDE